MRILQRIITLGVAMLSLSALAAEYMPDIKKSEVIVFINGKKYYVHTVKSGDTLYSIAKAYGVEEALIKENNPAAADGLKIDQSIKIPVSEKALQEARNEKKRKKDFVTHKIKAGQTLYSIARDYNISVSAIREDNPQINPQSLTIGQTLWIRRAEMGSSSEQEAQAEMKEYAENLNKATDDGYEYHVVSPGETIYSLCKKYGISESEFAKINDVSNGLKAGAVIRIPQSMEDNLKLIDQANNEPVENATIEAQSSENNVMFSVVEQGKPLNVALMLPMTVNSKSNVSYVEFYQGFLLGLEKIKESGMGQTSLKVYNTEHDQLKVEKIVKSPEFAGTNLIVGPVYEDELRPVIAYAHANSCPIVSPLANLTSVKSSAIYQLSPAPDKKYEKIANLIDGGRDIFLIYAASNDKEFEAEVMTLLKDKPYTAYTYSFNEKSIFTPRGSAPSIETMEDVLKKEKESLFIILASNETDVDRILGTISSAKVALTERSEECSQYAVLGTSRWGRFNNIDHTTYFNNNVVIVSTYHAKRDSAAVREFDSRYIESYNMLPSLYAYRGYDSAMIFCAGMRTDIEYNMLDKRYAPLQTQYKFVQSGEGDKYINQEWMRVNYNTNHTITLE